MRRVLFRGDVHARIPQSGQVERLPDAVFGQQGGGKQLVRAEVGQNSALIHEDDAVHAPPEDILQPMLDDEHGGVGLFLDLVDELHGLLTGGRVQIGQRLVEEQDLDLIHHNARQTDPLLLPAGKLMRCIAEVVLDAHQLRSAAGDGVHLILRHTAVFQRKGDVLAHGQANELAIRVLQYRAHMGRQLKDAAVRRIHAVHGQGAGAHAGIRKGVQAVDAARQRAFAAAGRACDEHTLPRIDVQVDAGQRGTLLGAVLEREISERDDGFVTFCHGQITSAVQTKSLSSGGWPRERLRVPSRVAPAGITPGRESPSWRWSWCRPAPAGRPPPQR